MRKGGKYPREFDLDDFIEDIKKHIKEVDIRETTEEKD